MSRSSVVDGKLVRVSPSSVKLYKQCARKWAFKYVLGLPEPKKAATQIGIDGHKRIEHYLKTGENVLTPLELQARRFIPKPEEVDPRTVELSSNAGDPYCIELAGVPLVGRIDWYNATGRYTTPEGHVALKAPAEVVDWKFSGDPGRWGMTADQIRDDFAMAVYALTGARWENRARSQVRLSHVYIATKKRDAFKRSALVPASKLLARVESESPTVYQMHEAAAAQPNDLEPNYNACSMYGGCPYSGQCERAPDITANLLFPAEPGPTKGTDDMGLLDALNKPADNMADKINNLEGALPPADDPPAPPPVYATILAYGLGFPTVTDRPDGCPEPDGQLAGVTCSADDLQRIAEELAERFPQPEPEEVDSTADATPNPTVAAPSPLAPPDAPTPTQAESAEPLPPEQTLTLDADVKAAADRVAAAQPPADPPKKKPGRPKSDSPRWKGWKKAELQEEIDRLDAELEALRAGVMQPAVDAVTAAVSSDVEVWVDCLPADGNAHPLSNYISRLVAEVAKAGNVSGGHPALASEGPLAFGRWKQYLAGAAAASPPEPGAWYVLHVAGDETLTSIVDGLTRSGKVRVHRGLR